MSVARVYAGTLSRGLRPGRAITAVLMYRLTVRTCDPNRFASGGTEGGCYDTPKDNLWVRLPLGGGGGRDHERRKPLWHE